MKKKYTKQKNKYQLTQSLKRPFLMFILCLGFILPSKAIEIVNPGVEIALLEQIKNVKISLKIENRSLDYILDRICSIARIPYGVEVGVQLDKTDKYNINVTDATVEAALNTLLVNTNYDFVVKNNRILIVHRKVEVEKIAKITVRGQVIDENKHPVSGATVIVLGTTNGAIADDKGKFSLTVNHGDKIEVSFMGLKTQIITLTGSNEYLVIKLKDDAMAVEEVVVTGIFNRTKELATGATYTVTGKELRQIGTSNILNSLRTLDPSFKMLENNINGSDPNKLPEVELRGANGIPDLDANYKGNPNQPLFIMDGFETTLQRVIDLDPNRVESISILKDAAAAALYGSRSANGVIVIETVAPEIGRLRLSYSGDYAVVIPDLTDYNLLNAEEALSLQNSAGHFNGVRWSDDVEYKEYYNSLLRNVREGVDTYWLSQPLRTAFEHRHNFNLSGGDDAVRYGVNFTARMAPGVMKGSARDNFQGGTYLQYRKKNIILKNDLQIGYNIANNSPYGSFSKYVAMNPYVNPFDENGNPVKLFIDNAPKPFAKQNANPLYDALLNVIDKESYMEVSDNFSAEIKIKDYLTIMGRFGFSYRTTRSDNYKPADHTDFAEMGETGNIEDYLRKGTLKYGASKDFTINGDINIRYGQSFGNHVIYAVVGANMRQSESRGENFMGEGFPNPEMSDIGFAKQYYKGSRPGSSHSISRLAGVLGTFNYSYNKKYLFDASIKVDGSSNFGANNRYAPIWSLGAGWNIHYEKFMQNFTSLSRLKIRGSYGVTGSQNFSSFQAMSMYAYMTDKHYIGLSPVVIKGLGNDDLKWQQTKVWNIGLEVGFLNDHFLLTADVYNRVTDNLLADVTIAPSTGFRSYKDNVGETQNKGIDLTARAYIIRNNTKGVFWNVNFSLAHNRNKILKISNAMKQRNDDAIAKAAADRTQTPILLYREGRSLSDIYAVRSLGIDPATGNEVYLSASGIPTFLWNSLDQVAVGNSRPKIEGVIGSSLTYKNFSLNVNFRYKVGGQIYNNTLVSRVENANLYGNVDRRVYEERWMKPGDKTFFKKATDVSKTMQTSRFVQDENVFSGEAFSLAYDVRSKKFLRAIGAERVRVTAYMNDVFRISTVKQERGIDYPFANRFSFSLNVTF